jgi:hypothetical protein
VVFLVGSMVSARDERKPGRRSRERTASAAGCVGGVLGGMWFYFGHFVEVLGGLRWRSA